MKNKLITNFSISGFLLFLFIILLILLRTVDLGVATETGKTIGLSHFNQSVFNSLGSSKTLYKITEVFGYVLFIIPVFFVVYGLFMLIKNKSFKSVPFEIYLLGIFYVVSLLIYLLFELVPIDETPILMWSSGKSKPSFPSSHVLMSTVFVSTGYIAYLRLFKFKKSINILIGVICLVVILVMAILRLISGVHWATDVIASLLLGSSLVYFYYSFTLLFDHKKTPTNTSNLL